MNTNKRNALIPFFAILLLMVLAYILTITIDCDGISITNWLLSPILVLGSDSGALTIMIIVFLYMIGGTSNCLDKCGFMKYMVNKIAHKYFKKRYLFVALVSMFFMLMGSIIGSFEEVVPLVPLCVIISKNLGFDEYTGIGMSLLAVGCGFAAGITNPCTIGVAQELTREYTEMAMFSGAGLRIIGFIIIYALLMGFLMIHAKRIAKDVDVEIINDFEIDILKEKAMKAVIFIMFTCILIVFSSTIFTVIYDYCILIMALGFLLSGVFSSLILKVDVKTFFNYFLNGIKEILPATILILMAASIKYTMDTSGCLDSIGSFLISITSNLSKAEIVIIIYIVCLLLEFFIASGSAKAFLLIPIVMPIALSANINPQICILAYAFGDGFSNVFYPTNPALLISLGLVNTGYKDWFKYSWKFQLLNFIVTSLFLVCATYII